MDLVRNSLPELKTIPDILRLQAADQPKALVAVDSKNGNLTYRELADRAWGLAVRITPYQPRTIAVLVPRSCAYLVAYFAGLSVGATLVPLDARLTPSEIRWTLDFCKADLLLHTEEMADLVAQLDDGTVSVPTMEFDPQDYAARSVERGNALVASWPSDPDDVALLLHTSGSLANPKRVMLTHRNVISNASAHALHMGLTGEDRVLIMLPMHFGYCNTVQILAHLLLGGTLVILNGSFAPHRCLRLVQEYRVTTFTAVPTMLLQLQAFVHREKYDTSSLRLVCFGGAPFPVERLEQLMTEYPHVALCQTYGQTEAAPRVTGVKPVDARRWPGSIGTPIPGITIKLLTDEGLSVEPGEIGEIVVQSAGVMKGYFGSPKETAVAIRDGWLYTGDLGRQGPEGEFYIVGRKKNFIIRGGINIYPEEIESVLLQHPAVEAVLVHGMPHEVLGEVPHACVVLAQGTEATTAGLRGFVSKRLATYKLPEIELVEELPRTYNGKVCREPIMPALELKSEEEER
jgi:long-chain acyl-CoA synthetase